MRTFTTDGPIDATLHHALPSATRLAEIRALVDQGRYFVFRAPGRSGKTTALRSLAAELIAEGRHAALCCSTKVASSAHADVVLAQNTIVSAIRIAAEQDLPESLRPPVVPQSADSTALWEALTAWAKVCPLPIVLFFDDVDSLPRPIIESLLHQFDAGFSRRPSFFPWSIGLVLQHDVRLSENTPENESPVFSTGPFEHSWSSRLLPLFTKSEIRALYAQAFQSSDVEAFAETIEFIHAASGGHPYFVQALGRELSANAHDVPSLTQERTLAAFRNIVKRLESPIDQLAQRLLDPRVQHVVEALFQGQFAIASVAESDVQFVRDLGLITQSDPPRINGALHRAIVPRLLAAPIRRAMTVDPQLCFDGDGRLYLESLLQTFASWYAENAPNLLSATPYAKIASELAFLAFLLQIVEGPGSVDIEFLSSRGFVEALITLPIPNPEGQPAEQREVILLVSRRKGDSGVKRKALEALEKAMLRTSSDSGTVVVFDKRDKDGKRRMGGTGKYREMATVQGKQRRLLRL